MKRVNVNKALTSKDAGQIDDAPSLSGSKVKVNVKPIPSLVNFLRTYATTDLEKRKLGIYKLSKHVKITGKRDITHLELTYKLGKTKYKIKSCTKIIQARAKMETIEGTVTIIKNLFNKKELSLKELPKNIVDSINDNISKFNEEYKKDLLLKAEAEQAWITFQKEGFFEGLDL